MRRTLPALAVVALSLTAVADAAAASYASRTLKVGSSGSDVRALQGYLDRAGFDTTADGQFGPATRRSVRSFELAESRRVNGAASRSEQRLVQERAETATVEQAPAAPAEKAYVGDDGLAVAPASAPEEVKQIIAAGNEIASKPYRYGGGHGSWEDTGYDCSGSVSYALHGADLLKSPMPSGSFSSWGEAGEGEWVTLYTNSGHIYMVVAGLRFDTSGRAETGSRWQKAPRSSDGFVVRHPEGL
jgi:cell wall-associated NlpC family hydrolase